MKPVDVDFMRRISQSLNGQASIVTMGCWRKLGRLAALSKAKKLQRLGLVCVWRPSCEGDWRNAPCLHFSLMDLREAK